jgi:arabinan endo-1,5-alpha-L-arabinosidase
MDHERSPTKNDRTMLKSMSGSPFSFTVSITPVNGTANPARSFEVTGHDPESGSPKTREYRLPDSGHKSYLDFFSNLARDFGTRLPRNRRPPAEPVFDAKYKVLLTENLAPGMLYGYGDPAVLRLEGGAYGRDGTWYYIVVTSNDAPDSFPIIRSRDLTRWEFAGFVFPKGDKPEWAADGEYVSDFWAPELHIVDGEFRMYFTARNRDTRELSIGVARSSSPTGPFIASKKPLLAGNTIDPHVFVDEDGAAYLYWKKDNNDIWPSCLTHLLYKQRYLIAELFKEKEDQATASFIQTLWPWIEGLQPIERFFVQQVLIEAVTSTFAEFRHRLAQLLSSHNTSDTHNEIHRVLEAMRTPVYAQRLSDDGLSLVEERVKVMENDQAWEAHLIEGMWLAARSGKYYLFYSGNDFSTSEYGIGVAIADSPFGPFRKMPKPLLRSTEEWSGPGHPSVAVGPDGEPLLFFHAYVPGRTGYKEFRALLTARIQFESDRVLLK